MLTAFTPRSAKIPFCAKLARQHTDSNVFCLGAKIIGDMMAGEIVKTWLNTDPFM
ncbi:RpiB/LacA/LacB family sugar-phosphate isomerase [Lactobacillus delbrueckii]|uniref:RpiB/LacA/LacB family sugar-phosphate isomerase n=1 Tax=Lactobacillus delbrueckii TaxID=1584 RepID=UPI0039C888DD